MANRIIMRAFSKSAYKLVFLLLVFLIGVRPSSSFAQMLENPGELEWLSFVSSSLKRQPELILLEEGRTSLNFSLSIPGVYTSHQELVIGDFTVLQADGSFHSNQIGQPDIPVFRKLIAVPKNVDLNLSYYSKTELDFDLGILGYSNPIIPVQSCSAKCGNPDLSSAYDKTVYANTNYLNQEVITILDDFIIRDQRYILCEISPISYNPSRNSIKVLPQITVTISWNEDGTENYSKTNKLESIPLQINSSEQVLNPPLIDERNISSNIGYLIITPDVFEPFLSPFISLKQTQGYFVTTAKLSQTGSTNAQIKSYIQNAFDNWETPPSYLLLVGDTDNGTLSVPAWIGAISGKITDLYYGTTSGNDHLPDILVGRLPARNIEQLNVMISKILSYEALSGNEEWVKDAAFLATGDPSNYWIAEHSHNTLIDSFTTQNEYSGTFPSNPQIGGDKLYAYTYQANNTNVISSINNGRSLIIFSGHGNSISWGTPGFTQSNVRAISTSNVLSLVTSFACETGNFGVVESFGETWMIQENKGAVAFIGASGSSYWGPDDTLERSIYEPFFSSTDVTPSIGQLLLSGLVGVTITYPGNFIGGGEYYSEIYNLQGDPSLQILMEPELVESTPNLEIENINNPAGYKPGETVIRSIMLRNMENDQKYISISISGNQWEVNFLTDPQITLTPNEEEIIQFEVDIPFSADDFDLDTAILTIMEEDGQALRVITTFSLFTITGYRSYLPIALNQ